MESKEPTEEKIIEAVKKYYGLKIDENAYQSADIYAYEETTADGYSVYVVTNDMNRYVYLKMYITMKVIYHQLLWNK